MDTCRPCGCKGCRTCLICEADYGIQKSNNLNTTSNTYIYCPYCDKAWPGWDINDYKKHPNHTGEPIQYPGVYIKTDFLTQSEEDEIMDGIDKTPWDPSQSGRRKQNYGPKCNFKKRKIKLGNFNGFPLFSKFIQDKLQTVDILKGFQTIEQCSLEYDPERGASIDPHVDDCWIWGERIITVNLISDSVLTMTYNSKFKSYNIPEVASYPSCVMNNGKPFNVMNDSINPPIVRIPMPRRSLLVMYGAARYEWEHQILREDIVERRVCLAYREFTPPYLEGGEEFDSSKDVLKNAINFY